MEIQKAPEVPMLVLFPNYRARWCWCSFWCQTQGKLATELEGDVQGAQMAAKPYNLHAEIPAIRWEWWRRWLWQWWSWFDVSFFRYEFASPEVLAGTTEALRKETLCMFTNEEVNQRSCHSIECPKKLTVLLKCIHTGLIKGQRRGWECSQEASPSSAGEV